jgi:myo-inositol 2-dehydrogenase/D-chiro-inositol 1-dehydrogenase
MTNTEVPKPVGVGLIGSQFVTSIHAEALRACSQADIRAVASPTPGSLPFATTAHKPIDLWLAQ